MTAVPKTDDSDDEYDIVTQLKETQVSARDWIIERETVPYGSLLGGFFCDPPGMGKTLSMIAAMQKRPGHALCPTLIIVPPQVITVWFDEFINRTTVTRDKIFIYYGPNRRKLDLPEEVLFVISTYAILRNECTRDHPRSSDGKDDDEPSFCDGSIFNHEFFRIILDEAHIAKNHKTKVSMSMTWLDAPIKWIITATPKINSLDDEYGSFRFLGVFESWEDWRSVVPSTAKGVSETKLPKLRLMKHVIESIKKQIMLRRPKSLLSLPPKTELYTPLQLSDPERRFYDSLQIYALSRIDALEQRKSVV